jgi:hypothetical protein
MFYVDNGRRGGRTANKKGGEKEKRSFVALILMMCK